MERVEQKIPLLGMSISVMLNVNPCPTLRIVAEELLAKSHMRAVMFSTGVGSENQASILAGTIIAGGSSRQSATGIYRRGNNGAQRNNIY